MLNCLGANGVGLRVGAGAMSPPGVHDGPKWARVAIVFNIRSTRMLTMVVFLLMDAPLNIAFANHDQDLSKFSNRNERYEYQSLH